MTDALVHANCVTSHRAGEPARRADSIASDPNPADPIELLPISYVEVDGQGIITRANRAARAMHNADESAIVGRRVWDFSPQADVEADRRDFLAMIGSGVEPSVTRRTLYAGGQFRAYELHRTLIRDPEGRAVGVRAATFDVTEAQLAHEDAQQAHIWLESVLDSMSEAIVITDALGFIRSVNPATEELFGWSVSELVGKVIEKAFPLLVYVAEGNAKLSFNMALESRSRGVATLLDRQRREVRVDISTSPIIDKINGFTIGVVSVMQPIKDVRNFVPAETQP